MKKIVLVLTALFSLSVQLYPQISLRVEITGLRNNDGRIMVQLFSEDQKVIAERTGDIARKEANFFFGDLKPGKYAVRFYHDENMNGILETNIIGKPTEGYGFSNNITGRFSMPPFEKWLFPLEKDKIITIKAVY